MAKRKTTEEKLAELEKQEQALKARKAKIKAEVNRQKRKDETRRKIILGGALMATVGKLGANTPITEVIQYAISSCKSDKDQELLQDFLKKAQKRPEDAPKGQGVGALFPDGKE